MFSIAKVRVTAVITGVEPKSVSSPGSGDVSPSAIEISLPFTFASGVMHVPSSIEMLFDP